MTLKYKGFTIKKNEIDCTYNKENFTIKNFLVYKKIDGEMYFLSDITAFNTVEEAKEAIEKTLGIVKLKTGDRVHISGYSDDLWIEDYHVSVDTDATVMETPSKNAKKILLTLDSIDGEGNVCCFVRKSKVHFKEYKAS